MTNYLLVYMGGGAMPATEQERMAELKAWEVWYTMLGGAVVDQGNPFTQMAKMIEPSGMVSEVPMGMMASGYSVLKADSLASAVSMAQGCPVLKSGGSIAVFETFNVM